MRSIAPHRPTPHPWAMVHPSHTCAGVPVCRCAGVPRASAHLANPTQSRRLMLYIPLWPRRKMPGCPALRAAQRCGLPASGVARHARMLQRRRVRYSLARRRGGYLLARCLRGADCATRLRSGGCAAAASRRRARGDAGSGRLQGSTGKAHHSRVSPGCPRCIAPVGLRGATSRLCVGRRAACLTRAAGAPQAGCVCLREEVLERPPM